ncbi:MAG: hypothetical protein JWO13_3226 [Acidobacteriales bacterium]|nr:hypothetical protein [Terriglobales bacterium]
MTLKSKRLIAVVIFIAISSASASLLLAKSKPKKSVAQMDDSQRALHALNRLTFGPRPGDIDKVKAIGVDKWIDQQLSPDKIDDSALQSRLEPFRTLRMDSRTLVQNFPPPQVIKAVADGRLRMPSDPKERAIYEAQLENYKNRAERKAQNDNAAATKSDDGNMANDMAPEAMDRRAERREARMNANSDADALLQKSPQDRFNAVLKMPADERRIMVQGFQPEEREKLLQGMSAEQREQLQALANPQGVITNELVQSKLIRAIYSERQLDEVMTDFWFNHFNVFVQKGADRVLTTSYERDAIRPHALGKFKDLLMATATHPAMLFYLDNFQSVGPNSIAAQRGGGRGANLANNRNQRRETFFQRIGLAPQPRRQRPQQQRNPNNMDPNAAPKPQRGVNENYARELMELHTLGVDGGYTQQDIIEVAKVLTGWTIKQPQLGGSFEFNDKLHEPGEKHILGQKINEDGEKEGKKVLEMLAKHPSTAKFISRKLAMRFVSDTPPQSLIDSMSATYLKSDGDIKEVLRTMFKSPEFWSPESYRAKVKTPLEFVVSAVRITGSDVSNAQPLAQTLQRLGMPLYGMQPPTGYSMKADAWVNSAALLNRMNFGLALASGKLRGISVNKDLLMKDSMPPADADAAVAVISNAILAGDISQQTRDTIRKQLDDPTLNQRNVTDPMKQLGVIAGLVLGSPEFQRR